MSPQKSMLVRSPYPVLVACWLTMIAAPPPAPARGADQPVHPLATDVRERIRLDAEESVRVLTLQLETDPANGQALSQRGDALFSLSRFDEAVRDYNDMANRDLTLDRSHWRRGIAWFYAGDYEAAASQFERYHSFDNVDRENGIWRYLSQARNSDVATARAGLLKYEKDDREPFPDVFRLFAGTIEPEQVLTRIDEAKLGDSEREARRFYAQLYIGLNHAVENRDDEALQHLAEATRNTWAPRASYGPRWMWHVGRVHWEQLAARAADASPAENRNPPEDGRESPRRP
ncbi:MAG: hypothetical protein KF774_20775 [Planctomyces sp.]|nr:hypothetical protein [Planctomyces sp.]